MFDDLLRANRAYASTFDLAGIAPRAAKGFALLTCMDTRIEPLAMLGLRPGDAKVIRNAGGRVTDDALRSLVLATAFLGVTEIAVMQHTNCALANRTDDDIRAGLDPSLASAADGWEFLTMPDPDAALNADVEAIRACKLLPPDIGVQGWRYDVETGVVTRVV